MSTLGAWRCCWRHARSQPAALPHATLAGRVLRAVDIASPPAAEAAADEEGGSWAPCVEVDAAGSRVFVSQYEARGPSACCAAAPALARERPLISASPHTASCTPAPSPTLQGSCVLEYSLPDLALRRRLASRELAGRPLAEPEGVVCANGCLYVAWLQDMAVSATPLEALDAAAAAAQGQAPAGARQRVVRGPPGQAQWIFWGTRLGPDGALYAAANPPYAADEAGAYGDLPPEPGRSFVARLQLNQQGALGGRAALP